MEKNRRNFIKKTATTGSLLAIGTVSSVLANDKFENKEKSSNGVVVGKSKKKEVLYKRTAQWEAFYKASY